MKILFDTSVLVSALVAVHPNHSIAFPWLEQAKNKKFDLIISCHSLAELYHVLTRYPVKPVFTPEIVQKVIETDLLPIAQLINLDSSDYISLIRKMADHKLVGGIIFDAIIAKVAENAKVDTLLTFNLKDFKRV